jgi:hypothetical protein
MANQTVSEFSTCAKCSNIFYTRDLNSEGVCSDCFFEETCCEASVPSKVNIAFGTAMASCERCSYRCAYWECPCELRHDCREYN